MKKYLPLFLLLSLFVSCSSSKKDNSISITSASNGVVKNNVMPFTLYLTDKIETRSDVEKKTNSNVFIIHTGHLLKANLAKKENEAILESLQDKGINAVNLSIEDFIIADSQEISFEKYPQHFLNSSVVDLNEDNIISKPNITPYVVNQGVSIIGLSDRNIDKLLNGERFLVSDYVLAILRARKAAHKESSLSSGNEFPLQSFVLVHTMSAEEIHEVLERLPPSFINSLAD